MSYYGGKSGTVKLDDSGGTLRTLSGYVTKCDLDLKGHTMIDVTTMGASGHQYFPDGLENCKISLEVIYDDTATTGPWVVLESLRDHTSAESFEITLDGTVTLSGDCWLDDFSVALGVGDVNKMSASLLVDGVVTVA